MKVMFAAASLAMLATTASAASSRLPEAPNKQERADCSTAIAKVRAEAGLPPQPAEKALLILAVDRQIDGCRVLVMANDRRDVRPEPHSQRGSEGMLWPAVGR